MRRMLVLGMLAALVTGALAESASAVSRAKTIRSADGKFKVFFPRGAMQEDRRVTVVTRSESNLPARLRSYTMPGRKMYEVRPHGLRLLKPATVTWRITRAGGFDASDGIPAALLLRRNVRGTWNLLTNPVVTLVGNALEVTAKTRRFSTVVAFDYGATVSLTPGTVAKQIGESFTATATLAADREADFGARESWSADEAVVKYVGDGADTRNTRTAFFLCGAKGDGSFRYHAEIRDTGIGPAFINFIKLLGGVPDVGIAGEIKVNGHATCSQTPTCAEPLRAAPTTHNAEAKVQITGQCAGLLASGLDHTRVDAPSGSQITEYNAHSTSCAFEGTVAVTCKIKPDGRICMILRFTPPLAAGTLVRVRLGKADGTVLLDQNLTVGANGEANCSTGP